MRLLGVGVALTVAVTAILALVWGEESLVPGLTFGLLATAIQLVATAAVRPALAQPFAKLMARWAIGMGLRLLGVVLFAVAVVVDRELFPPLPTGLGYLGVLLPLLYTEMRFVR